MSYRANSAHMEGTYPGALVRGARLTHRLGVLELVDVALELLDVVLELAVLAQLVAQHVDERLKWRARLLVLAPRGRVE